MVTAPSSEAVFLLGHLRRDVVEEQRLHSATPLLQNLDLLFRLGGLVLLQVVQLLQLLLLLFQLVSRRNYSCLFRGVLVRKGLNHSVFVILNLFAPVRVVHHVFRGVPPVFAPLLLLIVLHVLR